MPTVTAKQGDTLCNLAMNAGFLNCAPLRALPENADFLARDLKDGDKVTIPAPKPKPETKATTKTHVFKKKSAPPVSIRYVHGSPNIPYRQDSDVTLLNISNFRTTKGGANGLGTFPAEFEFHQPGHDDPDTFKVEVVDPAAGGSVNVKLEAMKPIYQVDIVTGDLVVDHHEPFGIAAREIPALECKKVRSKVAYRSKYLRLVVDADLADSATGDKQSKRDQTLLVTDMADGFGTGGKDDNDTVEILDQQVRASYEIQRCPGTPKCTVRVQAPIGGAERRKIAVSIHIFRKTVGGDLPTGVNEAAVRLRLFKWFRRLYAQANLGPKLFGAITIEEPPQADTVVISEISGAGPTGLNKAGGHSTISFDIEPALANPGAFTPQGFSIDLFNAKTPEDVANRILGVLPADITAEAFKNPRAFNATNASFDVTFKHTSGKRIVVRNEKHDDAAPKFTFRVVRPIIDNLFVDAPFNLLAANTPEQRRIMRLIPGEDSVLHFYCVERLVDKANKSIARGIAVLRLEDLQGDFLPGAPIRNKAFMAAEAIDGSDTNPFSFPHEAGHVLGDNFHVDQNDPQLNSQMMRSGTSTDNAERASKRINDTPTLVRYEMLDPAQKKTGDTTVTRVRGVERFRSKGAGLLRSW